LVDRYLAAGMAALVKNRVQVESVARQVVAVLADESGKGAIADLLLAWEGLAVLESAYAGYMALGGLSVDDRNGAQRGLWGQFAPFFAGLQGCLKRLDRVVRGYERAIEGKRSADLKRLKGALELLHSEVRDAEVWFGHVGWLQERFPAARYEDVVGLCRLAGLAEVKDQDFSLNPGRYVGVVIEEDGKTEEEFIEELTLLQDELVSLQVKAQDTEKIIFNNMQKIIEEN
jgi:type I restriction enzyme M protein